MQTVQHYLASVTFAVAYGFVVAMVVLPCTWSVDAAKSSRILPLRLTSVEGSTPEVASLSTKRSFDEATLSQIAVKR